MFLERTEESGGRERIGKKVGYLFQSLAPCVDVRFWTKGTWQILHS